MVASSPNSSMNGKMSTTVNLILKPLTLVSIVIRTVHLSIMNYRYFGYCRYQRYTPRQKTLANKWNFQPCDYARSNAPMGYVDLSINQFLMCEVICTN